MLYGEVSVSDLSLHVLRALRSVLWVVGCGSLVTPVPPTRARAPRSTLWTAGLFTSKFGKLILERKRSADDVKSIKVS